MLDVGVAPLADIAVGLTPMTVADVETAFLAALADALG